MSRGFVLGNVFWNVRWFKYTFLLAGQFSISRAWSFMGNIFSKSVFLVLYSWTSDIGCVCFYFSFLKYRFIFIIITVTRRSHEMRKLASKWGKKMLLINFHYGPSYIKKGKFCGYVWIALTSSLCRMILKMLVIQ